MQIHMLNEETINKIAAGEVIIRPVSVVKELVENAIDAGSSRITVSITAGGTQKILVSDDGCGIPWNEVQLAFERHATSKLTTIEDLQQVNTLGFRGEALSSIIAVAKVVITTRYKDEEIGSQTFFEDGKCLAQRVCGHDRGTVMEVTELFYNVPARQKQTRKEKTEGNLIRELMEKLALSHPEIGFTLISDDKKQFATTGTGDLKTAAEGVLGRGIVKNMMPLEWENPPMILKGMIGGLDAMRSTKDLQIFFINGRYVKNPGLSKAFEEAYEGYLMQHRHPVGIVFITLPGRLLDVNIHPAKTEIGLLNQSLVYLLFKQGIREVLRAKDLSLNLSQPSAQFLPMVEAVSEQVVSVQKELAFPAEKPGSIQKHDQSRSVETSNLERQLSLLSETVAEPVEDYVLDKSVKADFKKDLKASASLQILPKIDLTQSKIVGQLFDTYILLEREDEVFLIDQHAAHEAFMYEELQRRFEEKGDFPAQTLIYPQPVQVPVRLISDFEHFEKVLEKTGFLCDVFGPDTLLVRSVPVILGEPQSPLLIHSVIDHELYHGDEERSLQIQRIITMSCKAAVKGNQSLTHQEIRILIRDLMTLENPFTCPHGRPIIFRLKAYDLEKLFKRVV